MDGSQEVDRRTGRFRRGTTYTTTESMSLSTAEQSTVANANALGVNWYSLAKPHITVSLQRCRITKAITKKKGTRTCEHRGRIQHGIQRGHGGQFRFSVQRQLNVLFGLFNLSDHQTRRVTHEFVTAIRYLLRGVDALTRSDQILQAWRRGRFDFLSEPT